MSFSVIVYIATVDYNCKQILCSVIPPLVWREAGDTGVDRAHVAFLENKLYVLGKKVMEFNFIKEEWEEKGRQLGENWADGAVALVAEEWFTV